MRAATRDERGFTMIEVTVTITLLGLLLGMVVTGWSGWTAAHAHRGAAVQLEVTLRSAQQRAVTEGSSTCVLFDVPHDTWTLWSGRCDSTTRRKTGGPWGFDDHRLDLSSASFSHGVDSSLTGVTFTPRGTASPGQVQVRRLGNGKVYRVQVEGLTGRVSIS